MPLLTSPTQGSRAERHRNASFSFLLPVVIDTHAGRQGRLGCAVLLKPILYYQASHVSLDPSSLLHSYPNGRVKAGRVQQYMETLARQAGRIACIPPSPRTIFHILEKIFWGRENGEWHSARSHWLGSLLGMRVRLLSVVGGKTE